jgi:uncharacterized protein YecE (DUF72 family)
MNVYIGCSGFYNKDWRELFYPKGLAQKNWFSYYSLKFNSLELNTTFYRFPTQAMLRKFYDESPQAFKFSVKAPRLITHYKQFKESESLLSDFYTSVEEGLKEKLGVILFQLPAKIMFSNELLELILDKLNSRFNNAIEFRNASWWNKYVYNKLASKNIAFCGASIKDLPDEIISNTGIIYYRFHGITKLYYSEYTKEAIDQFADELVTFNDVETAYIFFNNTATMAAIYNAFELKESLSAKNLK